MKEEKNNIDFEELVSKSKAQIQRDKKFDEVFKNRRLMHIYSFSIIIICSLFSGIDYYYPLPKLFWLAILIIYLYISYKIYKAMRIGYIDEI